MTDPRRQLRECLLPATLNNAAQTPFYRELWNGRHREADTLETLSSLPLVRKNDLSKAGFAAQLRGGQVCDEVLSGGTTGKPFITLRGRREQERIAELFAEITLGHSNLVRARGLQIQNPQHGAQVRIPVPVRAHSVSIYDRHCFTYAVKVLTSEYDEPDVERRCSLIVASERCLRAFVQYLEAKQVSLDDGLRRFAISFGHYVPNNLRLRLEQAAGAVIVDRFSLSEVFGGATENPDTGWYVFDPLVLPEVVSLSNGEPVSEGIGELVLTALYPFQECQPIVRYATGDLVRVSHSVARLNGELHFKPLGRIAFGVISQSSRDVLLSAVDLYEAMDLLTWTCRTPVFRDSRAVIDSHALGDPRYYVESKVEGRTEVVLLSIQAPANRERTLDHARAREVHEDLTRRSPNLKDRIVDGSVKLNISIVDQLEEMWAV